MLLQIKFRKYWRKSGFQQVFPNGYNISGTHCDLIITSDNPRNEEPQAIIDDIKTGISKTEGKYVEIIDRKEAIAYAIHHGQPGDIIVLAGKGHEDYQEIKGKKYPMDERVLIREILEEDAKKKA